MVGVAQTASYELDRGNVVPGGMVEERSMLRYKKTPASVEVCLCTYLLCGWSWTSPPSVPQRQRSWSLIRGVAITLPGSEKLGRVGELESGSREWRACCLGSGEVCKRKHSGTGTES